MGAAAPCEGGGGAFHASEFVGDCPLRRGSRCRLTAIEQNTHLTDEIDAEASCAARAGHRSWAGVLRGRPSESAPFRRKQGSRRPSLTLSLRTTWRSRRSRAGHDCFVGRERASHCPQPHALGPRPIRASAPPPGALSLAATEAEVCICQRPDHCDTVRDGLTGLEDHLQRQYQATNEEADRRRERKSPAA
jgi:hypothetical protein